MNIHHKFSADISEIFNIVTASVYKNHEVFLRELVSNASDACEKLRFESNIGNSVIKTSSDFKIEITLDKDNKKLIIFDNGIGMNDEDLVNNLGMIASSGTKKFLTEKLGGSRTEGNLIGQFGIGFYSAFLVSKTVTVQTKKFNAEQAFAWTSCGVEGFDISAIDVDFEHGTRIILDLQEDKTEYLEKFRIKHLIDLYSKNIPFSIVLKADSNDGELLNAEKALWARDKNSITPEEYSKFFKEVGGVYGNPWLTIHGKVEGEANYTFLLYVPENKPFALFDPDRKTSVKLHVNKVFVTEDASLTPKYLRFVKGVVDSYDLPLSISRETVQQSHLVGKMNQYLTKKILNELKKASEEKEEEYEVLFWSNFGAVLKEGLCEPLNTEERESLLELCRFNSSKTKEKLVSLKEYIASMPENQKEIFYFNGENIETMLKNPQLEGFIKRDIEVLLLTDGVDDFWVNVVLEYGDKKFKSISQTDIDLNEIKQIETAESEREEEISEENIAKLISYFKEVLGDKIKDVLISKRLIGSPACLAVPEGQMNMKMERFLIDQKQLAGRMQKIFEINKNHNLIKKISQSYFMSGSTEKLKKTILNLFDFICIIEGEQLTDSADFSTRASEILEEII